MRFMSDQKGNCCSPFCTYHWV